MTGEHEKLKWAIEVISSKKRHTQTLALPFQKLVYAHVIYNVTRYNMTVYIQHHMT